MPKVSLEENQSCKDFEVEEEEIIDDFFDEDIFLSLNPFNKIDEKKIIKKVTFTHPYYDKEALENQAMLNKLQNVNNTLFCGSYFGYGFHEDGIKSSINMLKHLND